MNRQQIENYLPLILRSQEVRKAVCALERMRSAVNLLHKLNPDTLRILRQYVIDECIPKKGAEHEFARGYLRLVEKEQADQKAAEKKLYRGITGHEYD